MIDFINNMKAKQEDDLEVCDMEVDKIVDESITEISENDVSQESQVLYFHLLKRTTVFCIICRCLVSWSKVCVGCCKKHTLCSY